MIRGRGFGHGVGMSQYGAYGFAQHGRDFRDILGHYYRGTSVRRARTKRVRVLLMAGRGSVRFRGASACRRPRPRQAGHLHRAAQRRAPGAVPRQPAQGRYRMLRVYRQGGSIRLLGRAINDLWGGRYRGTLDMRPGSSGGVTVVNRIKLDHYIRGVAGGRDAVLLGH